MLDKYILSPDVDDVLLAIATLNNGASICPEHIEPMVDLAISQLGNTAVIATSTMTAKQKRKYLIKAASAHVASGAFR